MKAITIFKFILTLLAGNGIDPGSLKAEQECRLYQLSTHIVNVSRSDVDMAHLVALGYKESKFNWEGTKFLRAGDGSCGVFQQQPAYAKDEEGSKLSCRDLQDTYIAAAQAIRTLEWAFATYGRSFESVCHYNSGVKCYPKSRAYAKAHKKMFDRTLSYLKKNVGASDEDAILHRIVDRCSTYF